MQRDLLIDAQFILFIQSSRLPHNGCNHDEEPAPQAGAEGGGHPFLDGGGGPVVFQSHKDLYKALDDPYMSPEAKVKIKKLISNLSIVLGHHKE